MTIFGKLFMSKNGFSLITHLFKTIQTSSLVATPTKSGMPRRSKRSKHDFKIFIFRAPIFFGLDFLSGTFLSLVLKVSSLKTLTGERGLKNPIQRTTFYLQRSSGAQVMIGFMFMFSGPFFVGLDFCRVRLFLSPPFSSLVLKASSLEALTGRRGVKNPIQRTTFHLKRSSGARVMIGFVFAKFSFFASYFRNV